MGTGRRGSSDAGRKVEFSAVGFVEGMRVCAPLALTSATSGLLFGVLAGQTGLSILEAGLMSTLVFSGAAQFIALGIWTNPVPVFALAVAAFVVGLRHVLMGMAISPWFTKLSPLKAYISVFFMVDENWAVTMGKLERGYRDTAFLMGSGVMMGVAWIVFTLIGFSAGNFVQNPERWGLDFAFTAVFIALLVGMWKGKSDLLPWVVAGGVSVAAYVWLPGQWYILLGGVSGSLAGVMANGRK